MNASVYLSRHHYVGEIDPRIFSGFLEHMGRAVYEGIFDPGNPLSDERGFRKDVLEALRPMRMPMIRYPGGNFVSAYDWRDGIGPREKRPSRPDFAWRSVETNAFGTDEFMEWCRELGAKPMLSVNLGTAGAKDAAALLEYCNLPKGTYWADQRSANGHAKPYGVKLWCMGNEMDGPWQAGHVSAEEYTRRAEQAAKLMKGLDKDIEVVMVGSSSRGMSTYLEWDRKVLEYCWDTADYIAAHRYVGNHKDDVGWYLAEGIEVDRILEDYRGLIHYIRGARKSYKNVYVSFDEWNVWYREMDMHGGWKPAPHLLEEVYNLEDALVCAQFLSSFIRHADIVKVACIAQIANVIAPILTRPDGLLIQSIYHPFVMFSHHARGLSLRPAVECPTYDAGERGPVPALDVSACYDEKTGHVGLFLLNRRRRQPLNVTISLEGLAVREVSGVDVLSGSDPKARNTWESPHQVEPERGSARVLDDGRIRVEVPALGLVSVRLAV